MSNSIDNFSQLLGYTFKEPKLLQQALTHRSVGTPNNERLEFLGDSILGFVISAMLFEQHAERKEGELSRMRSSLVNKEVLAGLANALSLSDHLQLGYGERKSGGASRESIRADAMEALIGAIYLDGGLEVTRVCILRWYGELVDDFSKMAVIKDPKSSLQEWLQGNKYPLPDYHSTESGKSHNLTFTIVCTVKGLPYTTEGVSTSRRKAEQIAAQRYLDKIDEK